MERVTTLNISNHTPINALTKRDKLETQTFTILGDRQRKLDLTNFHPNNFTFSSSFGTTRYARPVNIVEINSQCLQLNYANRISFGYLFMWVMLIMPYLQWLGMAYQLSIKFEFNLVIQVIWLISAVILPIMSINFFVKKMFDVPRIIDKQKGIYAIANLLKLLMKNSSDSCYLKDILALEFNFIEDIAKAENHNYRLSFLLTSQHRILVCTTNDEQNAKQNTLKIANFLTLPIVKVHGYQDSSDD